MTPHKSLQDSVKQAGKNNIPFKCTQFLATV